MCIVMRCPHVHSETAWTAVRLAWTATRLQYQTSSQHCHKILQAMEPVPVSLTRDFHEVWFFRLAFKRAWSSLKKLTIRLIRIGSFQYVPTRIPELPVEHKCSDPSISSCRWSRYDQPLHNLLHTVAAAAPARFSAPKSFVVLFKSFRIVTRFVL